MAFADTFLLEKKGFRVNTSEPDTSIIYKAYVSEPITRCPPREKGRIRTLIRKIEATLAKPPYGIQLYIPSLVTSPEVRGHMEPEHVYLLDRIRIVECDLMLVCADHTSFGIGGEVEMATTLGKPIVIFSRADQLSRFLIGTPANAVHSVFPDRHYLKYSDWRDLKDDFLKVVDHILEGTQRVSRFTPPLKHVGEMIRRERTAKGMSMETLAERTGIRLEQIRLLELPFHEIRDELGRYEGHGDLDLAALDLGAGRLDELTHLSLSTLSRIAEALETNLAQLLEGCFPAISKGPSKRAAGRAEELQLLRLESLKARAAQFQISYPEFQQLEKILVDDVIAKLSPFPRSPATHLRYIQEKEFTDALHHLRTRPR